ncbi:MAG: alpha/beta hydrolase [Puia sp.]
MKLFLAIAIIGGSYTSVRASVSPHSSKHVAPDSLIHSKWLGFDRTDLRVDGRNCIIIEPAKPAKGNPWIWRTEFFGHEPQGDSALAAKGFCVVYMDVTDMYGAPVALDHMDKFYAYLRKNKRLNKRAVLEGFSRGGLFALNWAARHPERVSCIYIDAPVCDFKSWPGGKGKGPGSAEDWEKLKLAYGFKSDAEALAYKYNPVDHLAPLAKQKIPILSICGAKDVLVPLSENTGLVEDRYKQLGGKIEVILKPEGGHHPHSLKDPTPIVNFILENRIR